MLRAAGFLIFRKVEGEIQYLLLQASYGKHHWTPPKGHVDPGEDDMTTALRETKEEAGLDAQDIEIYKDKFCTLNYLVKGQPKTTVYWLAKLKDPEKPVQLSSEHTEFGWFSFKDAVEKMGHTDSGEMLSKMQIEVLKIV